MSNRREAHHPSELERKVKEVRNAITNKGNHPDHHDKMLWKLYHEWPTLYHAIMNLIEEDK